MAHKMRGGGGGGGNGRLKRGAYNSRIPADLFLVVDFLMYHLPEVRQNLVFSLGPFLVVEHGQCSPGRKN